MSVTIRCASRWARCLAVSAWGLCAACEPDSNQATASVFGPPAPTPMPAPVTMPVATPVVPSEPAPAGAAPVAPTPPANPPGPGPGPETPEDLSVAPDLLSETGLFSDTPSQQLGDGVQAYAPKYKLWSDNAEKRRWVRLPPGAQIDTSDMDHWRYPIGTKIWKEFAKDGQLLETRYMAKYGPDGMDWVFMAYQWSPDGSDATAVPDGVKNTAGTEHDIPNDLTCLKCHEGLPDGALGFSAIQLSHTEPGLNLAQLINEGRLTHPPAGDLVLPGDEVAQAALGYLHANCGHCHNPLGGEAFNKNSLIIYWQLADQLSSVEATSTYVNMVVNTDYKLDLLVKGVDRMRSRPEKQMPPVATEFVDEQGVAAVDAWVQRLVSEFPLMQ